MGGRSGLMSCGWQEFARVIEGFEERLVSVENNVHKELMAIKSIAESIVTASGIIASREPMAGVGAGGVGGIGSGANSAPIGVGNVTEERLRALEDGMAAIMSKLDAVALAVTPRSSKGQTPPATNGSMKK